MDFTKYLIPMESAQEGILTNLRERANTTSSEKSSNHKNRTLETAFMNVRQATMSGATGFVFGIVTGGEFKPGHAITSTGQPVTIIRVNTQGDTKSALHTASLTIIMPASLSNKIKPGIQIIQQNWIDKKEID